MEPHARYDVPVRQPLTDQEATAFLAMLAQVQQALRLRDTATITELRRECRQLRLAPR